MARNNPVGIVIAASFALAACGGELAVEEAGEAALKQVCSGVLRDLSSDSSNCGSCGHGCLGGTCKQGSCQPVTLATPKAPHSIATDDSFVYYVNQDRLDGPMNFSLWRVPIGGGAPALIRNKLDTVYGFVVDANYFYLNLEGPHENYYNSNDQLIRKMTKSGEFYQDLAMYWNWIGSRIYLDSAGKLHYKVRQTPTELNFYEMHTVDTPSPLNPLFSASQGSYWEGYNHLFPDGDFVYNGSSYCWVGAGPHRISCWSGGVRHERTFNANANPLLDTKMVANATQILWVERDGIYWVPPTVNQAPIRVYSYQYYNGHFITALAIDDKYLYWAENIEQWKAKNPSVIRRLSLKGGSPSTLASFDNETIDHIVTDAKALYLSGQKIWKLAK